MPVPIMPIKDNSEENNNFVDYSFLANFQGALENKKKKVEASNSDAELLMKVWLDSEKNENGLSLKENFSSRDIMRLKTYGFIQGSSSEFELTEKGKKVITVMALGEANRFEKSRVQKSYLEIMASMDKKGKKGYRIPKFASNNSNNLKI
jgi:hypothetical protein